MHSTFFLQYFTMKKYFTMSFIFHISMYLSASLIKNLSKILFNSMFCQVSTESWKSDLFRSIGGKDGIPKSSGW